jgi:thioredoxin 1
MITRRTLFPIAALFAVGASAIAQQAAPGTPFTEKAFSDAKKAGKSILLDVSAPWCPTCRAQAPIISKLLSEKKYQDVILLKIDFDSQKDVLRALNVRQQSTLIGFKGDKEVKRSTGDTNPMSIEDLIEATL